jgi:methyl-accepting chemotaxis protein
MPSVFSIFGELKADTAQFQNSLRAADALLTKTAGNIDKHAQGAVNLGKTTAVTARSYEKLQEKLEETRNKLQSTTSAFARGEATAKQMASALNATEKAAGNINSRLLDSSARLVDWKTKADAASGASKAFSLESLDIASSIGNVVTGLSNAAAGIANFVSFVFDGTKALFNFVKVASDFGSEIKDFQDKTGLGAEAITTIKFAAEQTGKSIEELSAPIGKFSKLLGEAADGSVKASKTLERFGLDP